MNFDGTEKKLLKGSHDLWERNRKIVYHQIWNPRAWFSLSACSFLGLSSLEIKWDDGSDKNKDRNKIGRRISSDNHRPILYHVISLSNKNPQKLIGWL